MVLQALFRQRDAPESDTQLPHVGARRMDEWFSPLGPRRRSKPAGAPTLPGKSTDQRPGYGPLLPQRMANVYCCLRTGGEVDIKPSYWLLSVRPCKGCGIGVFRLKRRWGTGPKGYYEESVETAEVLLFATLVFARCSLA